jgi:hypothetical protein
MKDKDFLSNLSFNARKFLLITKPDKPSQILGAAFSFVSDKSEK